MINATQIKKGILTLAIAVIFVLFIGYGIEVFHPLGKLEDTCNQDVYNIYQEDKCIAADGEWISYPVRKIAEDESVTPPSPEGYCNPRKECYEQYQQLCNRHDEIIFIVSVTCGLAALLIGYFLRKPAVSTGLVTGSIILILYGTIRYWKYANDILKFILLGLVLIVLIWVGYEKLEKTLNKKKRGK